MNQIENTKTKILLQPQLKNNGNFASNTYVDTAGFGHARFEAIVGVTDAAIGSTAETNPLKIEECDTTGGTYTDVTDAALADAIAATEDNKAFAIDVDLSKSHKRYMQVTTPHAGNGAVGANLCIIVILSKPDGNAPADAAGQGLEELIKA